MVPITYKVGGEKQKPSIDLSRQTLPSLHVKTRSVKFYYLQKATEFNTDIIVQRLISNLNRLQFLLIKEENK